METDAVADATASADAHVAVVVHDEEATPRQPPPPPMDEPGTDSAPESEIEKEERTTSSVEDSTHSHAESPTPTSVVEVEEEGDPQASTAESTSTSTSTPFPPVLPLLGLLETPLPIMEDGRAHRACVVYAPNEFVRIVPYVFSYLRSLLFLLLVVGSGGLLLVVSVWFPQVFTHLARIRLPSSCVGEAQYLLVLVQQDEFGTNWIEVPVHRSPTPVSGTPWWRRWLSYCCSAHHQKLPDPEELNETDKLKPQVRPWIWFEFKKHRYVFNYEKGEFERYRAKVKDTLDHMRARLDVGLDAATVADKRELFGRNLVDIDAPVIPMLLFSKVVHPYYLFQVFSSAVWFAQGYSIYAATILVLSAVSMAWEIYSEVANCNSLRALVLSNHEVGVFRRDLSTVSLDALGPKRIHERELVPGDIVELDVGPVVADVLLLSGGCIVDEASLTGEAVPINKEPAQNGSEAFTDNEALVLYKTSFLHAGSTITRVRAACGPCRGVVLSTGFSTGKGELFRSILFPRAISFEFERDSYRYLAVLATIAIAAFIKRLVNFTDQGYGIGYSIVNSLDLITIAVPPALPLVLSSGVGFALKRLATRGIFCIDAQRINSCGQLDTFCFDKTGTLTQESMAFVGFDDMDDDKRVDQLNDLEQLAMATCHSLSEADGVVHGSPLEVAMFDAATQHKPTNAAVVLDGSDRGYRVLKRFPFDAACQRSSVVLEHTETTQRLVIVKGSPEALHTIRVTPPKHALVLDVRYRAMRHAAEGKYCIAFGVRMWTSQDDDNFQDLHDRTAVEKDVTLQGIALFHNELKPESKGMLRELYDADMDVRMITGDNALTAVHVAKLLAMPLLKDEAVVVDVNDSCDVVYNHVERGATDTDQWPHLTNANVARLLADYDVALTGAALEQLRLDLSDESLKQVLLRTQIFARIRPTQKAWIVERLMDYGKIVGMCGDGTNDCGALKAAHVGLALSSAEASIVAPFTSKAKAVEDVPVLIREGRCALTTSFLGFKFMVLYPVIQLGMASTLGHFGTMLSNNQYIWDDLAIVLGLAITMLYTGSSPRLSKQRPPTTLFSRTIVASILGQIVLFVGFFAGMFAILNAQSWFCPRVDGMRFASIALRAPSLLSQLSSGMLTNCAFNLDYLGDVHELVDDIPVSHEGASVWLFGHMQYYCVALAFNMKDRFRLPLYTNASFSLLFLAGLGVNLWFLLDPSGTIDQTFQSLPLPSAYRWMMFGMFAGHAVLALVWEALATGAITQWREERAQRKQMPLPVKKEEQKAIKIQVVEEEGEDETIEINVDDQEEDDDKDEDAAQEEGDDRDAGDDDDEAAEEAENGADATVQVETGDADQADEADHAWSTATSETGAQSQVEEQAETRSQHSVTEKAQPPVVVAIAAETD